MLNRVGEIRNTIIISKGAPTPKTHVFQLLKNHKRIVVLTRNEGDVQLPGPVGADIGAWQPLLC